MATRSGTNQLHGTVFEFPRNTALNSNEFFANAQGSPKPEIKLNQYGFEVGGAIVRNKTFFLGSWAGQKINFSQPVDQTYGAFPLLYTPTAAVGVFRYFAADPANPLKLNGQAITKNSPLLVDAAGNLAAGVRNCASSTDRNCVASYNFAANDARGIDPVIGKLVQSLPRPNSFAAGVPGPVLFKDASGFRPYPDPGDTGSPRNIFQAPGYWNLDSAVTKSFALTERIKLQFRSAFFSILNHANFDNPRDASGGSNSILSTTFGRTCCATVAPPSTQTIVATGESARVIQFALKLRF